MIVVLATIPVGSTEADGPLDEPPLPIVAGLFGVLDGTLVSINPLTATTLPVLDTGLENPHQLHALTADDAGKLYAVVADGDLYFSPQNLYTIDLHAQEVELVGPVTTGAIDWKVAEGLAFRDPANGLYASAGTFGTMSRTLANVDVGTAAAASVASLSGTVNDEADDIVWAGHRLFAIDSPFPGIYELDSVTGAASVFSEAPGDRTPGFLAFDPITRQFYTALWGDGPPLLASVSLDLGVWTTIGPLGSEPQAFRGLAYMALALPS